MNSRVSSGEMMRDRDCSISSSGRKPSRLKNGIIGLQNLPSKVRHEHRVGSILDETLGVRSGLSSSRMSRRMPMTPVTVPSPSRKAAAFRLVGIA